MSAAENTQPQVIAGSPAITALPTGDEMVINLPEGQKVLLGKLPPGTIIEIASWRGTGPPDHQTARILLSTTSGAPGDLPAQPTSDAGQVNAKKKQSKRDRKKEAGPQHRKRLGAGQVVVMVLAVVAVLAVGTVLALALLN